MINGLYVLAFLATVFAAVYFIPKAQRYDDWALNLDNLDDEELAAALAEFPDLLDRRTR